MKFDYESWDKDWDADEFDVEKYISEIKDAINRNDKEYIMTGMFAFESMEVEIEGFVNLAELLRNSSFFDDKEIALEMAKSGLTLPDGFVNDIEVIRNAMHYHPSYRILSGWGKYYTRQKVYNQLN